MIGFGRIGAPFVEVGNLYRSSRLIILNLAQEQEISRGKRADVRPIDRLQSVPHGVRSRSDFLIAEVAAFTRVVDDANQLPVLKGVLNPASEHCVRFGFYFLA